VIGTGPIARALAEDRDLPVADPIDHPSHPAKARIDAVADEQIAALQIDDVDGGRRRSDVAEVVGDAERHRGRSKPEHGVVADLHAIHLWRQVREDRRGVVRSGRAVEQEGMKLVGVGAPRPAGHGRRDGRIVGRRDHRRAEVHQYLHSDRVRRRVPVAVVDRQRDVPRPCGEHRPEVDRVGWHPDEDEDARGAVVVPALPAIGQRIAVRIRGTAAGDGDRATGVARADEQSHLIEDLTGLEVDSRRSNRARRVVGLSGRRGRPHQRPDNCGNRQGKHSSRPAHRLTPIPVRSAIFGKIRCDPATDTHPTPEPSDAAEWPSRPLRVFKTRSKFSQSSLEAR
jgi:hypothetical protein